MSAFNRLKLFGRHRDSADATATEAVATHIAEVVAVATNEANVDTVAANIAVIKANAANISIVAADIIDVNTVAGNESNINVVAANIVDVAALAASITYHKSRLKFFAPDFRLDADSAKQGALLVVNGVTVFEMTVGNIAHMGDGFFPVKGLTQHDINLVGQMSFAESSKNINLTARIFDNQNALINNLTLDDVSVPDDTSEFTVNMLSVLNDTIQLTDTEGRIEIELGAATTSPHSGNLQLKKIEVQHV